MSPNPLSLYAFLTRRMLFLLVATFSLVLGCPGVLTASSGGMALENELIGVKIDTSTGKVTSLFNKQTGKEYWFADDTEIATVFIDHRTTSMWEAVPRRSVRLGSPTSWDRTQGAEGESLRLTFFDETYSITTILSLTIGHDEFLTWHLRLKNDGEATIARVDFPKLSLDRASFKNDRLVWPYREGEIIPNPRGENEILYPGNASMQWFQYGDRSEGLYVAVYDKDAAYKSFKRAGLPDKLNLTVSLWPFVEPGNEWVSPPVEWGVKAGDDWYWAGDRYRDWIIGEAGWTLSAPTWVEEMPGFGVQFVVGGDGRVVMPFSGLPYRMSEVRALGGDILEIKGWHTGGFDTYYPDYRPAEIAGGEDGLKKAVASIADDDGQLLFYMNSRIANKSTEWYRAEGSKWEIRSAFGEPINEYWNDHVFSPMCPAASGWQEELVRLQRPLMEMGGKGMFFDQTGAMLPLLCYNPEHGHSTPATGFSEGHWSMFDRFHQLWSEAGEYFFMTEGVADYLGSVTHLHALVWGFPFGHGPYDAPEITRYVLPTKILGLPEVGLSQATGEAYYRSYLMGAPFLDLPPGTRRLIELYEKEPDVFYRGRYFGERGLRYDHEGLRTAVHLGTSGERLLLIVWNNGQAVFDSEISLNLNEYSKLLHLTDFELIDVEHGETISILREEGYLKIRVLLEPGQLRTLKLISSGAGESS